MNSDDTEVVISDPKHKAYALQLERALKAFENSTEWADLIAALGKLNKVFQTYGKFGFLPRKTIVAKRLAQCLHPALPSGVHAKTLETYKMIFEIIGPDKLAIDLFLYSLGLYPLLSFATMSVKSNLLSLYETHFLPLGPKLATSLSGFILALLPGVEEGTESFDRTALLLDDICTSVSAECFYVNFWESICLSSQLRINALLYLNNHVIPKNVVPKENIVPVKYLNFMISGVCCCLTDENMLVQRNALDFIAQALPLHRANTATTALSASDKLQLLSAALVTLSKRDMSLSRRVFSWMLLTPPSQMGLKHKGSSHNIVDMAANNDVEFTCSDEVKDLLMKAIFLLLDSNLSSESSSMTFPQLFRILVTFVEKRPIGEELSDRVILAYIHYMYCRSLSDPTAGFKHCDLLFSNFGSTYIWEAMTSGFALLSDKKNNSASQFSASVSRIKSVDEWCHIVMYLLNGVSAQSFSASQRRQFPILLRDILRQMKLSFIHISYDHLCTCCRLCTDVIAIMQKSSLTVVDDDSEQLAIGKLVAESISCLQSLITNIIVSRVYSGSIPACKKAVEDFIISPLPIIRENKEISSHRFADNEDTSPFIVLLVSAFNLLLELHSIPLPSSLSNDLCKTLDQRQLDGDEWASALSFSPFLYATLAAIASRHSYSLQLVAINGLIDLLSLAYQQSSDPTAATPVSTESKSFDFESDVAVFAGATKTLNVIKPFHSQYLNLLERETCLYEALTLILWSGIASKRPGCHEQAAELLFVLHQISPRPTLCEDVICRQLVSNDSSIRHEAFKRFARFWHISRGIDRRRIKRLRTFNRCLLVFLESLSRSNDHVYPIVISWVEQVIRDNDLPSVIDPIFLLLIHPDTARIYIEKLVVVSSDSTMNNGRPSVSTEPGSVSEIPEDDVEKRIVAVASENGQVRFMTATGNTAVGNVSQTSAPAIVQLKNGKNVVSAKSSATTKNQPQNIARIPEQSLNEFAGSTLSNSTHTMFSLVTNPFEEAMVDDFVEDDTEDPKVVPSNSLVRPSSAGESSVSDVIRRAHRLEHGQLLDKSQSVSTASIPATAAEEFADNFVDSLFRQVFFVITGEDPEAGAEENSQLQQPTLSATTKSLELYHTNLFATDVPYLSSCSVHPLASHLLVYYESFDTTRVHHAIRILGHLITSSPQSLCIAMATTQLSAGEDGTTSATAASVGDGGLCATQSRQLRMLLAKHRCSLLGRNFYSDTTEQLSSAYRNLSYLELILHTLLHYLRSVHPVKENAADIDHLANAEVQIAAAHLLAVIVSNITRLLRLPQPPVAGFAEYITEILSNTRLVHILLYCVGISLAMPYLINGTGTSANSVAMKVAIDALNQRATIVSADTQLVYHLKMLVLLRCCAELEIALAACVPKFRASYEKAPNWLPSRDPTVPKAVAEYVLRFHTDRPLVYQPLLLFSVHHVLSCRDLADLHPSWLQLTISLLPSLCRATSDFVITAVSSICSAMMWLSDAYGGHSKDSLALPTDYLLTLLDSLSSLSNFTFSADSGSTALRPIVNREFTLLSANESIDPDGSAAIAGDSSFQLSSAARRTFTWSNWFRDKKARKENFMDPLGLGAVALPETRTAFIQCLPRLLSSASALQRACIGAAGQLDITGFRPPIHLVASPEAVLCRISDLLNPLTTHAPSQLLFAAAHVWAESEKASSRYSEQQRQQTTIVNLLLSLKGISFAAFADEINALIRQALDQKPSSANPDSCGTIANNLLSLFFEYMCASSHPHTVLVDGWGAVIALCRDCLAALPPAISTGTTPPSSIDVPVWRLALTSFAVLSKYVEIVQRDIDRKKSKEIQDVSQKACEAASNVAGLILESVTWFGRHYTVNHSRHTSNRALYEVTLDALNLISENVARLLDTIFDSSEKERAVNIISSMMLLMWPFLRDRTDANIAHFTAASKFLANLAAFAYNRRVWKKEAFELVSNFDSALFQVPLSSFNDWKVICDALMTFERQTFKDFILKMQSALSNPMGAIFVNQETEIQKRVAYLKRLAFIVFASDQDQYVRQLPEIQEKISESLRYSDSPLVMAGLFLLLRVLLLRFTSDNLTPFWPVLFTELTRVLMYLEKKVADFATLQEMVIASSATIPTSPDTMNWLPAFLAASKLLELILLMPRNALPQFQLSRWAFVDNNAASMALGPLDHGNISLNISRSLVLRIGRQMSRLDRCHCAEMEIKNLPILRQTSITNPHDLHPLFQFWSNKSDVVVKERRQSNATSVPDTSLSSVDDLETVVVADFIEMLPRPLVASQSTALLTVFNGAAPASK